MTGQHLVLCDGPQGDARAFRAAYAQYLVTCFREFVNVGPHLPTALGGPYSRLVDLVHRALEIDESLLLHLSLIHI